MANIKDLSNIPERLTGGHRLCSGCGASIAVRQVLMGTKNPVVVGASTGCLEVGTTIYPYTAWNTPFIHNAFENVAATISGAETAYRALKKKGKITKDIKFVAFGGDGGTYDIGLQSLSGALERGHNFVYVCLPPETEIILEDGSIVEIGRLIDNTIKQHAEKKQVKIICEVKKQSHVYSFGEEDERVESSPIRESLLSWNGREFVPMKAIRAQRKNSPKILVRIITSSGLVLELTEEHPVLIDGPNGPEWKEAALLEVGDEVYAARKINIFNQAKYYLIDLISENGNISVTLPPAIRAHLNQTLCDKFVTLKKASEQLRIKYWQFKEHTRKINLFGLKTIYKLIPGLDWEEFTKEINEIAVSGGNVIKIKEKQLNENLLYLLGLISADGYIRKQNYGITFINKETTLVKRFEKTYLEMIEGRKVNMIKDKKGIWYLTISDPVIYTLAKKFDIKNDPKEILKLPQSLIAAFLRGYFDGDGHCSILRHKHSQEARIILSTTEKLLAARLRLLLQRLGIAGFQDSRKHRFDIIISSGEDIKRFIEFVGSSHPKKEEAMKKIEVFLKKRKSRGKYFSLAPRVCGKLLKECYKKYNIPITKIDKKGNISTLVSLKRRATKQKVMEYLNKLEKSVQGDPLIYKIKNFLINDFYLDPIKKVEIIEAKSKYVYDLTVEPSHVFVPGGKFIISNCYDNEGYMNCLSLDTMIMTKEGLKKIADIKVGDKVYAFDQKRYQAVLKKCTGVFSNGVKEVFKVETLHNSIKATGNHPFLVLKRNGRGRKNHFVWKTVDNLKIGDEVIILKSLDINKKHNFMFKMVEIGDYKVNRLNKVTIPFSSSPDLMKYIGMYVGDGWTRLKKGEVGFALPKDTKGRKVFKKLHNELFGNKIRTDDIYIYINSVNLAKFIDSMGIGSGAKNKTIPGWVFTLPKEEKESLVQGLMLSDGYTLGKSHRYVSASPTLLKSLRLLLQTMDYRVGKIHWQRKEKGTRCVKRILLKDAEYGYICFSKKRKWNIKKYPNQYRYQDFLIDNENFKTEKITDIKSVGLEPTLDLRVEDEHNFIADGFVVHNTGIQRSSATPRGASTTTAPAGKESYGKTEMRKDLTAIVAAHNIPYAAQGCISHWNDLVTKSQKAFEAEGPAFLNVLALCHRGWRTPPEDTIKISRLAVETGFWPLIECERRKWRFTYKPKERKPVVEFLKTQGRFRHLFKPEENKPVLEGMQKEIDEYWEYLEKLAQVTA